MSLEHLLRLELQSYGATPLERLPENLPISNSVIRYLVSRQGEGLSGATLFVYSLSLVDFVCFLKDNELPDSPGQLTRQHIDLYMLNQQKKPVTQETRHVYYRGIKTFFNWLVEEGEIEVSPMAKVKPPKLGKKIPQPYTRNDLEDVLKLCSGKNFLDARNRAIILVLYDTGLRLDELTHVMLSDINRTEQTIRVVGKGNKERIVRYGKAARMALMMYFTYRKDELPNLWLTEERRPMTEGGLSIAIRRLSSRAQVSKGKRGAHRYRHTFAIDSIRNGANIFYVQELLGHATLEMTKHYAQFVKSEEAAKAHQKFSPADNWIK